MSLEPDRPALPEPPRVQVGVGDTFGVVWQGGVWAFRPHKARLRLTARGTELHLCAEAVLTPGLPTTLGVVAVGSLVWLAGQTPLVVTGVQVESGYGPEPFAPESRPGVTREAPRSPLGPLEWEELRQRVGAPVLIEGVRAYQSCCLDAVDPLQAASVAEDERRRQAILREHGADDDAR